MSEIDWRSIYADMGEAPMLLLSQGEVGPVVADLALGIVDLEKDKFCERVRVHARKAGVRDIYHLSDKNFEEALFEAYFGAVLYGMVMGLKLGDQGLTWRKVVEKWTVEPGESLPSS